MPFLEQQVSVVISGYSRHFLRQSLPCLASYTTVFIDYPTDFWSSHCLLFNMATPADISDEDLFDFVEQDYRVDLDLYERSWQ